MNNRRLGIFLIVLGVILAALMVFFGGSAQRNVLRTFGRANVGCEYKFQFDRPGTYYVFVETGASRVVDAGCPPSESGDFLDVVITNNGTRVPMLEDTSITYDYEGATGRSIRRFDVGWVGTYQLEVTGPNVTEVVAIGRDPSSAGSTWTLGAGLIGALGVMGGIAILLFDKFGKKKAKGAEEADEEADDDDDDQRSADDDSYLPDRSDDGQRGRTLVGASSSRGSDGMSVSSGSTQDFRGDLSSQLIDVRGMVAAHIASKGLVDADEDDHRQPSRTAAAMANATAEDAIDFDEVLPTGRSGGSSIRGFDPPEAIDRMGGRGYRGGYGGRSGSREMGYYDEYGGYDDYPFDDYGGYLGGRPDDHYYSDHYPADAYYQDGYDFDDPYYDDMLGGDMPMGQGHNMPGRRPPRSSPRRRPMPPGRGGFDPRFRGEAAYGQPGYRPGDGYVSPDGYLPPDGYQPPGGYDDPMGGTPAMGLPGGIGTGHRRAIPRPRRSQPIENAAPMPDVSRNVPRDFVDPFFDDRTLDDRFQSDTTGRGRQSLGRPPADGGVAEFDDHWDIPGAQPPPPTQAAPTTPQQNHHPDQAQVDATASPASVTEVAPQQVPQQVGPPEMVTPSEVVSPTSVPAQPVSPRAEIPSTGGGAPTDPAQHQPAQNQPAQNQPAQTASAVPADGSPSPSSAMPGSRPLPTGSDTGITITSGSTTPGSSSPGSSSPGTAGQVSQAATASPSPSVLASTAESSNTVVEATTSHPGTNGDGAAHGQQHAETGADFRWWTPPGG